MDFSKRLLLVLLVLTHVFPGSRAERLIRVASEGLCEKTSNGHPSCQVAIDINNDLILMDFDGETTLSDVRARIDSYAKSKGGTDPFPKWELLYKGAGTTKRDLVGDKETLLSLGVEHATVLNKIIVKLGLQGGIMYGEQVDPSKYDFAVLIFYDVPKSEGGQSVCTGTIYNNIVLTAAHCVYGKKPESFHVMLAHKHFTNTSYSVREVIAHPHYDPNDYGAPDVGIMILNGEGYLPKTNVRFNRQPLDERQLQTCYLAGFGVSEHGGGPTPDRPLVVGQFQLFSCAPRRVLRNIEYYACAESGPKSYTAGCSGDSGGPWFTKHTSYFSSTTFTIFGVHHGSDHCNEDRANNRDKSDVMLLAESVNFWGQYLPQ